MKLLAGIVTFNPDINRLQENFEAILPQVDKVIIVDNGSSNLVNIQERCSQAEVIPLYSNKGIAAALNVIGNYAIDYQYDWFLTLDQDTVVESNLISIYKSYINLPNVGTLSCLYHDLNQEKPKFTEADYQEMKYVITSASFMKTEAFKHSNKFDEWMFIDMVDFDINFEFQRLGYKIYRINQIGFIHEVGESSTFNFMGRIIYTSNHSAIRKYYRVRNSIYLYKKYGKNSETVNFLIQCRDEFVKIFLFEKNKVKKLSAMIKGLKDGILAEVTKNESK
ncbi:glycosyltransferase [Streptococcus halotolerans]|uniref:glycosyltransferase n=1 Tax=Streptococcus halotolerans TaxID=1814128 RepID=UPI000787866B|nr:glycosyltransferase [Streptococcus halotolerans]